MTFLRKTSLNFLTVTVTSLFWRKLAIIYQSQTKIFFLKHDNGIRDFSLLCHNAFIATQPGGLNVIWQL